MEQSIYKRLSEIDCSKYIEQKNGLNYLSWAAAVQILLEEDPHATWHYHFWNEKPFVRINDTAMVFCTVKAFGIERTAQLPVMDHRNKSIPSPDAFQVNVAMQRALAKAIALHGLGLYIYRGEDMPLNASPEEEKNLSIDNSIANESNSLGVEECNIIRALAKKAGIDENAITVKYDAERLEDIKSVNTAAIIARLQEVIKTKSERKQK